MVCSIFSLAISHIVSIVYMCQSQSPNSSLLLLSHLYKKNVYISYTHMGKMYRFLVHIWEKCIYFLYTYGKNVYISCTHTRKTYISCLCLCLYFSFANKIIYSVFLDSSCLTSQHNITLTLLATY